MSNIGEMCEVENRYIIPIGHKHGWGLMSNIGEMCEVENRYIIPTGHCNMAGV